MAQSPAPAAETVASSLDAGTTPLDKTCTLTAVTSAGVLNLTTTSAVDIASALAAIPAGSLRRLTSPTARWPPRSWRLG